MITPIEVAAVVSVGTIAYAVYYVARKISREIRVSSEIFERAVVQLAAVVSKHEAALKTAVKEAIAESIIVTRPSTAIEQKLGR